VIRPVRTAVVEAVGGALDGTFAATIESGDEAALSFRIGGTVATVDVAPGQRVEEGQVLATLDATDLRLQLQQAEAAVRQAQANAQLADSTLNRVRDLYVSDNASAADVEGAKAQQAGASAGLVSAIRQRDLVARQLEGATLVATRAGTIASVKTQPNVNVGAGTPIVVLSPDVALQATVAVPAKWLDRLRPGHTARVSLPELDKVERAATVAEIGGRGATAGAFPVTVQLAEKDPLVRPGMVAQVTLSATADGDASLYVPLAAIAEDQQGRHVWAVVQAGEGYTVQRKPVTTGELTADGMAVSGVEAGTRVVTAGIGQLYEGRPVRLP
jgi:RND family efflux transporter MFP subunit